MKLQPPDSLKGDKNTYTEENTVSSTYGLGKIRFLYMKKKTRSISVTAQRSTPEGVKDILKSETLKGFEEKVWSML